MADEHTHEYRISANIPLSGTDRAQSAIKAQIGPLLDQFEEAVKALGLAVIIKDSTVKLGLGKKTTTAPTPPPNGRAASTVATEAG